MTTLFKFNVNARSFRPGADIHHIQTPLWEEIVANNALQVTSSFLTLQEVKALKMVSSDITIPEHLDKNTITYFNNTILSPQKIQELQGTGINYVRFQTQPTREIISILNNLNIKLFVLTQV